MSADFPQMSRMRKQKNLPVALLLFGLTYGLSAAVSRAESAPSAAGNIQGLSLAAHFGDGTLRAADAASGLVGAVIKDPVQDRIVWQEYLETVVKEREGWKDLYRACRQAE